ncbi:hypothetical protein BJ508DRAFT_314703 [Ascobolus immersus RN42]|uniref:Uncharacterized protein n=1 Tax=Ascobolus immersus RN42 TaxID=1160509 RepID=A0A3N4HIG5_ASCIM|nr:hypothetical protein BJ508DRAFT_314703 [Ascobolus immersus RN42]
METESRTVHVVPSRRPTMEITTMRGFLCALMLLLSGKGLYLQETTNTSFISMPWKRKSMYTLQLWPFHPSTTTDVGTYTYCEDPTVKMRFHCPIHPPSPAIPWQPPKGYPSIVLSEAELDVRVRWHESEGYLHIGQGMYARGEGDTFARDWPDAIWNHRYMDGFRGYQGRNSGAPLPVAVIQSDRRKRKEVWDRQSWGQRIIGAPLQLQLFATTRLHSIRFQMQKVSNRWHQFSQSSEAGTEPLKLHNPHDWQSWRVHDYLDGTLYAAFDTDHPGNVTVADMTDVTWNDGFQCGARPSEWVSGTRYGIYKPQPGDEEYDWWVDHDWDTNEEKWDIVAMREKHDDVFYTKVSDWPDMVWNGRLYRPSGGNPRIWGVQSKKGNGIVPWMLLYAEEKKSTPEI